MQTDERPASLDGLIICPLPKAPRELLPYPLRTLMKYSLFQRGLSFITWLFSSSSLYEESCNKETTQFVKQMWKIHQDETKTVGEKALLLEAIAAYGLASRPATPYLTVAIPLPIYRAGVLLIEPCLLIKELFLHRIPIRVFAPASGHGSPIYLFPPTGGWPKAPGMTMQILDDFNPMGPGTSLQNLAKEEFPPFLNMLIDKYQEKACFLGHSLGGILATSVALEMPRLVQHVCAFSPSRPFPAIIKKWNALHRSTPHKDLPNVHTYIPEWTNGQDPITWLGGNWIGTVHRIRHRASNNPLDRHAAFLIPQASQSLHHEPCDSSSRSASEVSVLIGIHRIVVTCLLLVGLVCISLKRLLVGWKHGRILRFGLFGLPYTLYLAWRAIWPKQELNESREAK